MFDHFRVYSGHRSECCDDDVHSSVLDMVNDIYWTRYTSSDVPSGIENDLAVGVGFARTLVEERTLVSLFTRFDCGHGRYFPAEGFLDYHLPASL